MDLTILMNNSKNTLYSLRKCLEVMNLSDAMTLFRKLKDDLILFIYFLRLGNITAEDYDSMEKLEKWNKHVQNAYDWVNNSMKNVYSGSVIKLLKKDIHLKALNKKTKIFSDLFKLHDRLNDYSHSNGISYITRYNPILLEKESIFTLKYMNIEIDKVFAYLFTIVFYISPHYLSSPDYQDYMEMEMTPPEDCQYWISSYFNEFINKKICKVNPKLKEFLIDNTYMNIK